MGLASGGVSAGVVLLARLLDTTGGAAPSTSAQPAAGSGQGPEWGEAAPIGLLIILLMGGALFVLMKSMNRNLRRVPVSFDAADDRGGAAAAGPDREATGSRRRQPDRVEDGAGDGDDPRAADAGDGPAESTVENLAADGARDGLAADDGQAANTPEGDRRTTAS